MRRAQDNLRCHARIVSLPPPTRTQTPTISRVKTGKLVVQVRRAQVVSLRGRKAKKVFRHHSTYRVHPVVSRPCVAETITVKPRHRIRAATLQFPTNYIPCHRNQSFQNTPKKEAYFLFKPTRNPNSISYSSPYLRDALSVFDERFISYVVYDDHYGIVIYRPRDLR